MDSLLQLLFLQMNPLVGFLVSIFDLSESLILCFLDLLVLDVNLMSHGLGNLSLRLTLFNKSLGFELFLFLVANSLLLLHEIVLTLDLILLLLGLLVHLCLDDVNLSLSSRILLANFLDLFSLLSFLDRGNLAGFLGHFFSRLGRFDNPLRVLTRRFLI